MCHTLGDGVGEGVGVAPGEGEGDAASCSACWTNAIPELKRVVVVHGGNVTISTSLADALATSLGQPSGGGGGGVQPPPTGTIAQLLQQALAHYQAAQRALMAGDLAGYQREINLEQDLIRQAIQLGTQTPSPSPSISPSPSPSG